ncbi:MAG TPA: D-alanyl-D-alanine carboxypeptidase family protein [Bacillota bacterium]|nr:D-alanyl-D-alanine carboxypeptidase family protein [Bacillota bacterium]
MASGSNKRVRLNYLAIIKALVFLVAVILAVVLMVVIIKQSSAADESDASSVSHAASQPAQTSDEESQETSQTQTHSNYTFLSVDNSLIYEGSLILVNNEYGYSFPSDQNVNASMADTKTDNYYVSDRDVALRPYVTEKFNAFMAAYIASGASKDIIVVNGYLDYSSQATRYQKIIDKYGEEQGSLMAAKPGGVDAHTGLSVELKLYISGSIKAYDSTGTRTWIEENAYLYGFILRFPEGKAMTTGLNASSNKYRYVGLPHSAFIKQNGLTLEEYIVTVQNYRYDTVHWTCELSGVKYEVYYVPADDGSTTDIPVPTDSDYTISGNNVEGFIVTVTK